MSEIEKLQLQINDLRSLVETLISADKLTIQKTVKVNDGRNFVLGKTTGTKFGTEITQKLAFYGKTPIVQQASINVPTTQGVAYNQTDVNTIVSSVTSIITLLRNYGFIA